MGQNWALVARPQVSMSCSKRSNCNLKANRQDHYQTKQSGNVSHSSRKRLGRLWSPVIQHQETARLGAVVKESLNRASQSSKECSRELPRFSPLSGLFHPRYRVPLPKAWIHQHSPGSMEIDICSLASELGNVCISESWVFLLDAVSSRGHEAPQRLCLTKREGIWSCSL